MKIVNARLEPTATPYTVESASDVVWEKYASDHAAIIMDDDGNILDIKVGVFAWEKEAWEKYKSELADEGIEAKAIEMP